MFNFTGLISNNFAVHQIDYVLLTLIKSPKSLSLVAITLLVSLFTGKPTSLSRATLLNVIVFTAGLVLFNLEVAGVDPEHSWFFEGILRKDLHRGGGSVRLGLGA